MHFAAAHLAAPTEQLLVDAFDRASTGLVIVQVDGTIVRLNHACAAAIGYAPDELAGRQIVEFFPPRSRANGLAVFQAALARDISAPGHWTVVAKDGTPVEVLVSVRSLPESGGRYAIASLVDVTGVAAVESRLSQILAEQKALLDNTLVGILFSSAGRIVRLNARCAEMLGSPVEELVGQPTHTVFQSLSRFEAFGREAGPVLARGEPFHGTLETSRRDGATLWLEIDAKPVNAPGAPAEAIWTFRDITDRRRAETALDAASQEQRAILDNASVGIAFTRERRLQRCNQAFAALFGYAVEELVGQSAAVFYRDAGAYAEMGRLSGPSLARGEAFHGEFEFRRRDGVTRWCRVAGQAVHREAPDRGTVWIVEDITDERRAEHSLKNTVRDLELILEHATVGIVFVRENVVQRCSRRYEEMLGYAPGEFIGRSTAALFETPEAYQSFQRAAKPVVDARRTFETEVRHRRKSGELIWCRVSGRAVEPTAPELGRIWIVQDVTAQREVHDALARSRIELEQRVRERTADLGRKNRELEVEIEERRHAEDALRIQHERIVEQTARLLELAQADKSDFETAVDRILGTAVATLHVDCASFWRVRPDGESIACEHQYFVEHGPVFSSAASLALDAASHPAYFAALRAKDVIAAEDALAHPATASLADEYLKPLGIVSTLDIPVWLDGRTVGLFCAESRRERRAWRPEDVDFASGTAVIIALALEASQRQRAERRLRHLAHHDSLTGLPNRNLLDDRLRQALALASRQGSRVAVMFLDLDRFKTINDSLGHVVGDRLLEQVAARLNGTLRAGDTVARLGGDEFVLVLPGLKGELDAATVASGLLSRLAPPFIVDGRELHVSASIGIGIYPEDGPTAEALMRNADTAMYHAKDSGRNRFRFFAATMNAAANLRLELETELRGALKRGEFELHYQPIYEIATWRLRALEALARWRHPRGELLLPASFLPLAEETGLILDIGRWSLAEACAQAQRWRAEGRPEVPVSVNLSARQFREPEFVASVGRLLERTGLEPRLLEIEVSEGALIHQSPETLAVLDALVRLGVKLAIDDFGVGYSNLVSLRRFAIERIKVDRSFVRNIPGDADAAALAAAIVSMSRSLKLRVVAEGVETDAQLAFLAARGCDEVQGHLFCPALPPAEAARIFGPPRP